MLVLSEDLRNVPTLNWFHYTKITEIFFEITAHGELFASLVFYPHHLGKLSSIERQLVSFSMLMQGRSS
jgi:hypothetical protein